MSPSLLVVTAKTFSEDATIKVQQGTAKEIDTQNFTIV
jgi:hypothetical protein